MNATPRRRRFARCGRWAGRRAVAKAMSTRWRRRFSCSMPFAWRDSNVRAAVARARRVALACCCVVALGACESKAHGAIVKVTIPPGASLRTAADSLHRAGLVAWPRLFRYYAKATGDAHDIKAGTYALRSGESWEQLITALRDGEGLERKLTIPEGWNLLNIVPA